MIIRRIELAFKLAWFGFCHPELLGEQVFVTMGQLLEHAFLVAKKDRPFTTHLMMGDKRIVSFWMYPGLAKNPVDIITELLSEVDALKETASTANNRAMVFAAHILSIKHNHCPNRWLQFRS